MRDRRIDIIIKDLNLIYFQGMLIDFFRKDKTPAYPIYIHYDSSRKLIGKEKVEGDVILIYESTYRNFKVVVASEDENVRFTSLANISMQQYPKQLVIFVEEVKEMGMKWRKVEKIVREIISQIGKMKWEIEHIEPVSLLPNSSQSLWEQIPDHGRDREILKLWHDGYTNSEIGKKMNLEPASVTNLLSRLRGLYGKTIVPLNEQRRRDRRSKKW